jgi:hypothetical protein
MYLLGKTSVGPQGITKPWSGLAMLFFLFPLPLSLPVKWLYEAAKIRVMYGQPSLFMADGQLSLSIYMAGLVSEQ